MHYEGPHIWSGIILEGAAEMMLKGYGVGNNMAAYYPLSLQEAFARGMASRLDDASETVKLVLLLGEYIHRHYHNRYHSKAQNLRVLLRDAYDRALEDVDMLAMPTIPFTATPIPEPDCAREIYVDRALNMQANTCPFDVSGHPGLHHSLRHEGRPAGRPDAGRAPFRGSPPDPGCVRLRSEEAMSNDLHYLDLVDVARRIKVGALSPVSLTEAMLQRIGKLDGGLKSYVTVTADLALEQAARRKPRSARRLPRAAARRADRRQGPVLHQGHPDRAPAWRSIATSARPTMHRRAKLAARGRRGHARQAAADRRRVRGPPSRRRAAGQSLACGSLVGRVVERLGRRDCGRAVLRRDRHRHRRVDPLPVGRQRR